jgi:DNA polymerase-1
MSASTKGKSKSAKETKKRLVLLDAHAIIHRAYHALPPEFANSKGEPTGALYGLCAMLIKIIEELKPDYLVAAFDRQEKTHRHEAYEEYKGKRSKADESLVLQLERAKDVFIAWGIPIYSCPGFEADDILGTIAHLEKKNEDVEIIIASGDMDTLSLVDGKRVRAFIFRRGVADTTLYDEAGINKRYGFGPELLPDLKGIMGDQSDNIIGVPGVGEGSALKLIQTFGTIEKIYKALKKDGPEAVAKKVGIQTRYAKLMLDAEEEALFSKTLATIRCDAPVDFKLPKHWREELDIDKLNATFTELEFRTMPDRVKRLLKGLDDAKPEASRLNRDTDSKGLTSGSSEVAKKVEEDKELELALWVVDSNITNPKMEDVFSFTKAKDLAGAWKVVNDELDRRKVRNVFEDIEKPLIPVVEEMNKRGVRVDKKALEKLSKEYHAELSKIEKKIYELAGEEFNISSPKQLGEILFVKMGLASTRQKKTSTGGFSTKESELEKLKDKHPIIELILEYRELSKLLSTYIDSIPDQLDEAGRLHSTFILSGSTTGRMASQSPNLQNIPIRTELGRNIRKAFISERSYTLLSLDYSQIELRIAAILSKDKKLIEIFKNGEDVHTGVAMRVFGVKAEEVDKAMRIKAKTINFGVLFGMGVNALRANLKTDRKEAQEFYNQYFSTFKELAAYIDETKAFAERNGYTETLFGRRRYFSGLRSPLPYVRAQAERMAFNAPIQGTEADIVKIAMKRIDECVEKNKWRKKVHAVLQVHDEIVYEVEEGLAQEAAKEFKHIMENVLSDKETYGVPIVAEANIGTNWNDVERI